MDEDAKSRVRAALARAGIVLPEADVAFLAAQLPMLERLLRAVESAS